MSQTETGRDAQDPFDLGRFLSAQASVYPGALAELRGGHKRSHWMWFIFPQIAGLGSSAMSQRYALRGLDEALAYLAHPVLGARLRECVAAVLAVKGRSASDIFDFPDDRKLHSSLTLFARADGPDSIFGQALEKYFGGAKDPETLRRLAGSSAA